MPSRRTRPRAVTGVLAVLLAVVCSPLPRGTAVAVAARSNRAVVSAVTGVLAVLLAVVCSPLPRGTAVAVAARSNRAVDPLVNVARGKPVRANVTCGSPTEDFFPHSDLLKPPPDRHLQICDASNPALAHNASLMTDGNSSTWWQSTSLQKLKLSGNGVGDRAEVFITLDLGETYYPENITIHMGDTIRPGRLAVMRSADGLNFDPWLYLVTNGNRDCRRFGVAKQRDPDSQESVVCREYAQLEPQLYNERISVSLSEVPPSFSDEALLRWQAVRYLQVRFYDMDLVLGRSADQFDHYAVSEISVMAGCKCNGFGKGCEISADSGQYECICSGNTQGPFCEECQPLYNQFPYQPGRPCQGQRVYLTTIGSWSFYKVRASGPMTSANVKFTCEAAGMRYPCFASGRCTGGWTPDCIKYDDSFISCETHWVLSFHLCGHDNPYRCEPLDDTFVYMDDWWSDGSACGMKYNTDKWWCVTGADVNNLYALCADLNECEPSPCVHGTCTDDIGGYTCTCENGWEGINCDLTSFNGECYQFSSTVLTHQDATQACSAKNGHLVDLTNEQQQSFLADKMAASNGASYWLGIKSAQTAFLYSNGSPFSGMKDRSLTMVLYGTGDIFSVTHTLT
ncbi:laminin subunit gamma-3-like [Branchiostoma floridae x Branchiostoma japonicum]